MKILIGLAFILLTISTVSSEDHRYCQLHSCLNRSHTLCKYPDAGAVSSCGTFVRSGLMRHEKDIVLELYNNYRPPDSLDDYREIDLLADDYYFKWDRELEEIAQRWADQCIVDLDECRNVDRFNVRQQAGISRTPRTEVRPSIYKLVTEWSYEDSLNSQQDSLHHIRDYITGLGTRYNSEDERSNSAFILELLWQRENRIGCGSTRATNDEFQLFYLVCNYGRHDSRNRNA